MVHNYLTMTPSSYQKEIYRVFKTTSSNINISAVAGSGKTTVLIHLLNYVPAGKSAIFLAFNKSIVSELKERIENKNVEISTLHAFGWRLIMSRYGGKVRMNEKKLIGKIDQAIKKVDWIPEKKRGYYFYMLSTLVDLMRHNLCEKEIESVQEIADRYDIPINDQEAELALKIYAQSASDKSQFDFTDMIYQPVTDATIRFRKFDYVFCDESQDFSLAQQNMIKNIIARRGRLITVGDPRQAIYGFAGADSNSYESLSTLAGESVRLPLSVCYRCGKRIVQEAQKIVPEIDYHKDAEDGEVRDGFLTELKYGDWVVCRNVKPLIQTYLWLMKNKIKSHVRGRDIGEGLKAMVIKTGAKTIAGMMRILENDLEKLKSKLEKRGVRRPELHPKVELFLQRLEVIECLIYEVPDVKSLLGLLDDIFSDEVNGILLTTIHKSKGLENDVIFFLCPELIPSVFATQPWQFEQEYNLKYVAITRAKKELIYVDGNSFKLSLIEKIKL